MGFYNSLKQEIMSRVGDAFPLRRREKISRNEVFSRLEKEYEKVTTEHNFTDFWLNCVWLKKPSKVDVAELTETLKVNDEYGKEQLKTFSDFDLEHVWRCLMTSLKQLVDNDFEGLDLTESLHQYYLIAQKELNTRLEGQSFKVDAYLDYLERKKHGYVSPEKLIEKARKEGLCPICNSKEHVISYGDKWKCKVHNKYWRKS